MNSSTNRASDATAGLLRRNRRSTRVRRDANAATSTPDFAVVADSVVTGSLIGALGSSEEALRASAHRGATGSLRPYPRVEGGVDDVGQQSGQQDHDRREYRDRGCDVDVLAGDALYHPLTHAVPAEDLFGEDRTRDESG